MSQQLEQPHIVDVDVDVSQFGEFTPESFEHVEYPRQLPEGMTEEAWLYQYSTAVQALEKITARSDPDTREALRHLLDIDAYNKPDSLIDIMADLKDVERSMQSKPRKMADLIEERRQMRELETAYSGGTSTTQQKNHDSSAEEPDLSLDAPETGVEKPAERVKESRFIKALKSRVATERDFSSGGAPPEAVSEAEVTLTSLAIRTTSPKERALYGLGLKDAPSARQAIQLLEQDTERRINSGQN
jgi:hypothetical protein